MFWNKNEFNQQFAHFVNINSNAEKSIHEWCIWDTQIWMCSNYMQKIASINSDSNKFMSAGQEVCSWEYVGDFINPTSNSLSSYLPIQSINPSLSDCKQGVHSDIMNVRKRSIGLPDIDENLLKILSLQIFLSMISYIIISIWLFLYHLASNYFNKTYAYYSFC